MEVNVGDRDRLLRLIFGIYSMLLGFLFIQGVVGAILGAVGLVLLITGLVRRCGIYTLLGISTVSEEAASEEDAQAPASDDEDAVDADDVHAKVED